MNEPTVCGCRAVDGCGSTECCGAVQFIVPGSGPGAPPAGSGTAVESQADIDLEREADREWRERWPMDADETHDEPGARE